MSNPLHARNRFLGRALIISICLAFGCCCIPREAHGQKSDPCPQDAVVRVFVIRGIEYLPPPPDASAHELGLIVPNIGHGSGSVISADGLVLTAKHVVEGATGIAVLPPGKQEPIPAELVYMPQSDETRSDFAFIKVDAEFSSYFAKLPRRNDLKGGDSLVALGYPIEEKEPYPATVTGTVRRTETLRGLVEVSNVLDSGISGGPVCDDRGLIGVAVAYHTEGRGMNYAVPIGTVADDYESEVLGKRLKQGAEKRMVGDAWQAYAAFSVLAAKMLLHMPQNAEGQQAWLTGHGQSGTGRAYFEEFERLLEAAPSPEVLLVIASFFWNDALVSMWGRDCGGFMCASDREFESMMLAAGLAWTAVKEKPELLQTGGTAAELLYTTREKIEREEMTEAECADGVDNDRDGMVDCRDNSCQHHLACGGDPTAGGENSAFLCQDKIDNDGDRSIDCDDDECRSFIYCSRREPELSAEACQDGVDNDMDGTVDCGDRDCAEQFKFCDDVGSAAGGRPPGEWEDWANRFLIYGGMLFRNPFGSNTDDVELWGFGFAYQRRIVGWNAARWFHLDTAIGIGGTLHKWPDREKFSAGLADQETQVPEGVAFALSLEPTLRLVLGTTVGAYVEGYYPLALLFADPFSAAYKVWGMRVGVYFTDVLSLGLTICGITPGSERYGLWTMLITLAF